MRLFDILQKNALTYPNTLILEDENNKFTFKDIEEISARIYNYLCTFNFKKEDIVAIKMKRSAKIFLAMLGVWKVGLAFVVIGDNSPQDYVEHALKDTNPKLIFDDECYEKATSFKTKHGYKKVNLHDLACVVYSTGSTGVFKGSMHEYGAIEEHIKINIRNGYLPFYEYENNITQRFEQTSGFYSMSAILELIYAVFLGYYYYIFSYEDISNLSKYLKTIKDKKIEHITIAPSFYNKIKKYNLSSVKEIGLTYDLEPIKLDKRYSFLTAYGCSESFGLVTFGIITKDYDIIPIGKAFSVHEISIRDKDKKLKKGEIGEICIFLKYFRGYKNLKQLTDKVFYNGVLHTGDIGYFDEENNYFLLGRKIDMLKLKQGYIIPSLITVAIRKKFSDIVKNHIVLFGNEKNYKIVVYYCGEKEYTIDEFRDKLKDCVEEYMLPTHCVKMDDFEYFPSGKIKRLSFVEPK